jgi:hypothetical protein
MVKTVENIAALPIKNVETDLFYYCVKENVLARYNGTKWD